MAKTHRRRSTQFEKRTGLRWGIYARLSEDKKRDSEDEGENVETQIEFLTKWIRYRDPDADIVKIYVDNDIPASGQVTRRNVRPEYNRMISDAKNGVIQAAAARHLDRYTRRPRELEDMLDIHDVIGTEWHCATGEINLALPAGRAMARMLIVWGAYEGDLKVERMQISNEQRAREGKVHRGGMRCYGYTDDGTALIDNEVAVIREMREWILPPTPKSVRSLCAHLSERGIGTVTGARWTPTSITRLLKNPRLRGARTYHDEVVKEEAFPRIFTDEEFAEIEAFLADPDRAQNEPKRKTLLSGGILICGRCGNSMMSQPSNSKRPGYVCRPNTKGHGCGSTRIQAEATDADVAAKVLAVYVSPKIREQVRKRTEESSDSVAAEELKRLRERLADLGRQWAAGDITTEARAAAENYLRREINAIQGRMREAQRLAGVPADLPMTPAALAEWWTAETTTLEERRAVIMSVLKHVSVGPTMRRGFTGFEPERLTYVWR
jgi:DNA invertase Pin-like site-specific DNA recombinase